MEDSVAGNCAIVALLMEKTGASIEQVIWALETCGGNDQQALELLKKSVGSDNIPFAKAPSVSEKKMKLEFSPETEVAHVSKDNTSTKHEKKLPVQSSRLLSEEVDVVSATTLTEPSMGAAEENASSDIEGGAELTLPDSEDEVGGQELAGGAVGLNRVLSAQPIQPGAEAVPGPNATEYDTIADDDITTTPMIQPTNQAPYETTISAEVVDTEKEKQNLRNEVEQETMQRIRDETPVAQVVNDDGRRCRPTKLQRRLGIAGVVMTVGVIIGIVAALGGFDPDSMPAESTESTAEDILALLSSVSLDDGQALQNPSTPQNKAFDWLANSASLDLYSDSRKIQRYALATLYYSTNGDDWFRNDGWLSNADECAAWYSSDSSIRPCLNGSMVALILVKKK